jgi:SAM-dependent methyltransferase
VEGKDLRIRHYPESRMGDFIDGDGTLAFYLRVNELVEPGHTVLDVGCGRGAFLESEVRMIRLLRNFRGRCARVMGIDVHPAAADHPALDEFRRIEGKDWPVETASVDVAVADFVVEHLHDPDAFFAEAARVLRRGGALCLRTTNRWGYVSVLSRLVPERLHARLLKVAQPSRASHDVFPAHYSCNTVPALRRMLSRHGFDAVVYGHEADPSYLSFSPLLYRLAVLHRRLAPSPLRLTLFAFARRR